MPCRTHAQRLLLPQEVQPSPLALLAATCSKIGSPTDSPADESSGGDGGNGDAGNGATSPAKATTATVLPSGELVAQYVQAAPQTVGILNQDGTVTQVGLPRGWQAGQNE